MRIPFGIASRLGGALIRRYLYGRKPDLVIGGEGDPYLARWFVIPRNRLFNVYLHAFYRSDDDRALHDHPWVNCSILLLGEYTEHTIAAGGINLRAVRIAGDVVLRRATAAHRIELHAGATITLFITGPRIRLWGFHCPAAGWVPWQKFVDARDAGAIGRGCDQ